MGNTTKPSATNTATGRGGSRETTPKRVQCQWRRRRLSIIGHDFHHESPLMQGRVLRNDALKKRERHSRDAATITINRSVREGFRLADLKPAAHTTKRQQLAPR